MGLTAIIIDDEKDAIDALREVLLTYCKDVNVLASTTNPKEGIEMAITLKPDFIFLDIEMPGMNGFEFLDSLPIIELEVLFVTAYDQYAIKAIKKNALDYILKPIGISEIVKAVDKVRYRKQQKISSERMVKDLVSEMRKTEMNHIKIPTIAGFDFVNEHSIIRLQADGSYTHMYLNDGANIMISRSIKEAEPLFDSNIFFRIHRSHIINLKYIKRFFTEKGGVIEMSDGSKLPLSRRKKEDFIKITKLK